MKEIDVKIVKLEPMRMISIYEFGEQPEELAWEKFKAWIQKNGFKIDPKKNRIFGFNNPCPTMGSTKYGYEFWMAVGPDIEPDDDARIVDFSGGLYAVADMNLNSCEEIPEYWEAINIWFETSKYNLGQAQWLEETSIEGMPFSIYLSIQE